MNRRIIFWTFGALDIALVVAGSARETVIPSPFVHLFSPAGGWHLVRWLLLASLVVSGIGLVFEKKWAFFVSYAQFPLRFKLHLWTLGVVGSLLIGVPAMVYYTVIALECARLGCSIWLHCTAAPPVTPAVEVKRPGPLFGPLSIGSPLAGFFFFLVGMCAGRGEQLGSVLVTVLVGAGFMLFGLVAVLLAFIRWEKSGFLPVIGLLCMALPMLWSSYRFTHQVGGATFFAGLLCIAFGVVAAIREDQGRRWSALAVVPLAASFVSACVPLAMRNFARL